MWVLVFLLCAGVCCWSCCDCGAVVAVVVCENGISQFNRIGCLDLCRIKIASQPFANGNGVREREWEREKGEWDAKERR